MTQDDRGERADHRDGGQLADHHARRRRSRFAGRISRSRSRGIAWDGGYGIARSKSRSTAATSGRTAALGEDLGRFAFRAWSFPFTPTTPGKHTIMARASNAIGQTQADSLILNPAGYHNNVPFR